MIENELTFEQLPSAVSKLNNKLENIEKLLLEKINPQANATIDQLLSIQEAAKLLNLAVSTIYSKVSKRELPVMKQGKRLYFSKLELIEHLKKGRKKSNSEIKEEANHYLNKK